MEAILGAKEGRTECIDFVVPGRPRGKDRPRATTVGGRARVYTPGQTTTYERQVAAAYRRAGGTHTDGPVALLVDEVFAVPKSVNKQVARMMLDGQIYPRSKPDGDNVLKIVMDALNGVAYDDDVQVAVAVITRRFGEEACVGVTVMQLEGGFNRAGKREV